MHQRLRPCIPLSARLVMSDCSFLVLGPVGQLPSPGQVVWPNAMVQTSKTDHFFKLAPFRSPLLDLIDFGMAWKLLTSATRRCSLFVDGVSRIWIKPKKSLIGCWAPTATRLWPISAVASTTNDRLQRSQPPFECLPGSAQFAEVCVREKLSWTCCGRCISVVHFPGSNVWQWNPRVLHSRARSRAISWVIVKVTSSSDLEKIRERCKSTRGQAGRFQPRGILRMLKKQFLSVLI